MTTPAFNMRQLIEAGVHFGHKTKRWNPRMAPFLYGARNDIHIIDLGKTAPMLHKALEAIRSTMAGNGRLLFVGTKRQAADPLRDAAKRCGQYYINQRWLGGLLTNWGTIQNSIRTLKKLEEKLGEENVGFTKKEILTMTRDRDKLEASLGGIKDMGGKPDMLFIIDVTKEDLAVKEARKLGIPIVAIIDSNASPEGIDYPIPGNDDSSRAIQLYCDLVANAALSGIQQSMSGAPVVFKEPAADGEEAHAAEGREEENNNRGRGGKRGAGGKKAPVVEVKKTPARGAKKEE